MMGDGTGLFALLTAGVNLLAALASRIYLSSDARLLRKIGRDAALLKELPEAAQPVMEDLIKYEVEQHSDRRKQRAVRHIYPGAVLGMIFIAGLTFALSWGLAYLAVNYGWWWWVPFGALTGSGLLLMVATGGQIFYYGDKPPGKSRQPSAQV
ncbi:hypothetical protein [Mycobacterium haemophilum]|uniref:Transmembrane protein n=3 Tax=Mycobacterium haemophilum TaxID=29311 RepID=A0A0I9VHP6_9MYCO|nr:hypothetical protein [Mycobacterium haemophilum]KLO38479.1 hypothetical protein ABH38_03495 [Mycobacterium haemophilum]KLO44813.1 hypothetical protein ABH37_02385 [Mycobacterium haemophilum]KLO56156.1 hypothetical protein ABH36_02370 [Mycobacterium haemophilum]